MRKLLVGLLLLPLISCAPPEANDSSDSASQGTLCTSSTVASVSLGETLLRSKSLSENSKVKLDMTVTSLKQPSGPGQFLLDFKSNLFDDPNQIIIPAKTKLVAVVDHNCTRKKGYTAASSDGESFSEIVMSPKAVRFQFDKFQSKLHSHTIELSGDFTLHEIQQMAEDDECLKFISSSISLYPAGEPTDPSYIAQQKNNYLGYIDLDMAYDEFYTMPGITDQVVIAIIDSGVAIAHDDLAAGIWVNPNEIAGNGIDDAPANGYIDDVNGFNFVANIPSPQPQAWPSPYTNQEYHGTHVAGLAAARTSNGIGMAGVAGNTSIKIMALNVFGNQPSADTATIDEAIRYAYQNGADVINLSLGGFGKVASTGTAIQEAIAAGTVVVAAAGNSNRLLNSVNFMTPASYAPDKDGMLAVGSVDVVSSGRSSFSNCGKDVIEIAAPGAYNSASDTGGLYSTIPANSYYKLMGTSMSAPLVSGTAALIKGLGLKKGTNYTPAQIESIIKAGATVNSTLTPYFKDGKILNLKGIADSI